MRRGLELGGQGCLRGTFSSCNLFPQGLQPEGSFPFQGEGIRRLKMVPCHRA